MKLIKVYTAAGELEAEMIKGFLQAQGLDVTLSQESVARTLGLTAGKLGEVQVLVREEQVAEAQNLLAAMQAGEFEDTDYPEEGEEDDDS
ncbi:DUF2007 domain-containing protein [bacterium]|nr:DUF2007 domain-containing protein [bacterium]